MSTETVEGKLQRLKAELNAILLKVRNDGRKNLNPEEKERYARIEEEFTATSSLVTASGRVAAIDRDLHDKHPEMMATYDALEGRQREEQLAEDRGAYAKVFSKYLRSGLAGFSEQDERLLRNIRAAQTLTTTGGGYVVPQGFSDKLEVALKWASGMVRACGEFTTANGAPLTWPTMNDTTNTGVLILPNVQLTEQDITLGQVSFGSSIFSSGTVLLTVALAEDSYFSLDDYLAKALGVRLGRVLNSYLTTGTGTAQPTGIVTAVVAAGNIVTGATGETVTVSYNDLSNLIEAVDEGYLEMPTTGWMMSQSTRKIIRTLKDSSNRPLWTEGLVSSESGETQDRLLGFPVWINNSMPTMAANAYPILFGDFSRYMIRKVASGTTVRRLVERYADYLQVGYLAYTRADGQLLDAGTHPIAAFQNSAT